MKKLSVLLFLTFYVFSFYALKSQHLGTKSLLNFGTKGWESVSAMTSDPDGNYYVAGTFSGTIDVNGSQLTSNGQRDIFLIKYNSENVFQWKQNYGGASDDHVYSISCDFSGNIHMVGSFQGESDIGSDHMSTQTFTDLFYAKIDNNRQVLFAKPLSSGGTAKKAVLQTDTDGNIWMAGSFEKNIELDASTSLTATSGIDIFFAKYDPEGVLSSVYQKIEGDGDVTLEAFVLDNQDNVFIGGSFTNNMQFGTNTVTNNGKEDLFVAKYLSSGSYDWHYVAGGLHNDKVNGIACDGLGALYVTGDFTDDVLFDLAYTAPKHQDVFLLKFNESNGVLEWSNQLGDNSYCMANSIVASENGYVYISGSFRGELQSDVGVVSSTGKTSDAFIIRYQSDGTRDWVSKIGGEKEDKLMLSFNKTENKLATYGYFSDNLDFLTKSLTAKNYKDIFLSPIVDCDNEPKVNLGNDTTLCQGSEIIAEGDFVGFLWADSPETASRPVGQDGIYEVTVTDKYGCTSTDDINITIIPQPLVDLGTDLSFCEGDMATLDAGIGFTSYLWNDSSNLNMLNVTESGFYSVEVTDGNNCKNSDTVEVTVNPLPIVDLGGPELWVPKNTTFTLSTPGTFVSYLWSTGETTSTITLESRWFRRAAYVNLDVMDDKGCSGYDEILVHEGDQPASSVNNSFAEGDLNSGSDVQEEERSEESIDEQNFTEYKIYPNPNDGKFFIGLPKPEIIKQVDIFDARGNRIKTFKNIELNLLEIDVSNYAKGLYLIYIREEKISKEFKIIYN